MTAPLAAPPQPPSRAVRAAALFRLAAHVEALTWAGLLVGMLFKYVLSDNEIGVQVFGPIHGIAFLCYLAATIQARRMLRWSWGLFLGALVASIPPLLTWPFERWASRRGALPLA